VFAHYNYPSQKSITDLAADMLTIYNEY